MRFAVGKRELELAVPRPSLNFEVFPPAFEFKWADNVKNTGDEWDFMLNGDSAPNDRFNYRAKLEVRQGQAPRLNPNEHP